MVESIDRILAMLRILVTIIKKVVAVVITAGAFVAKPIIMKVIVTTD